MGTEIRNTNGTEPGNESKYLPNCQTRKSAQRKSYFLGFQIFPKSLEIDSYSLGAFHVLELRAVAWVSFCLCQGSMGTHAFCEMSPRSAPLCVVPVKGIGLGHCTHLRLLSPSSVWLVQLRFQSIVRRKLWVG